jgi:hypothetical protein
MDCVFGGSAALGAMRCLIKRCNLQGASKQCARVGTAPLVSSVGCASSPFTSLRSTHPYALGQGVRRVLRSDPWGSVRGFHAPSLRHAVDVLERRPRRDGLRFWWERRPRRDAVSDQALQSPGRIGAGLPGGHCAARVLRRLRLLPLLPRFAAPTRTPLGRACAACSCQTPGVL